MSDDEDKLTKNENSPEDASRDAAAIRNLLTVNDALFGIILDVATEDLSIDDGSLVANIMSGLQDERQRYIFSLVIDAAKKVISQADSYLKAIEDARNSKAADVPVIQVESIQIEELDIMDPTTDDASISGEHQITLLHTMLTDIQRGIRSLNEKLSREESGRVERLVKSTANKRSPNLETRRKIRELAELRQNHIDEFKDIPKWFNSCQNIPINPETARYNAPKLRENWGAITYIWSEEQEDWGN